MADGAVAEIRDPEAEVEPAADEFGSKDTDKGALYWEGEEDLKEGDAVYVRDEDGNQSPAPDGDYRTEDGKVITVVDGVVASIKDDEAEVAPEPEPVNEELEALRSENAGLKAEIATLREQVEKLSRVPLKEHTRKGVTVTSNITPGATGDKGMDRLARYVRK